MVVVAQTPEVVEGDHLQVGPGENVRQLLADGFEDADSPLFLETLRKGFLDFSGFVSTNPETLFRWACSCGLGSNPPPDARRTLNGGREISWEGDVEASNRYIENRKHTPPPAVPSELYSFNS